MGNWAQRWFRAFAGLDVTAHVALDPRHHQRGCGRRGGQRRRPAPDRQLRRLQRRGRQPRIGPSTHWLSMRLPCVNPGPGCRGSRRSIRALQHRLRVRWIGEHALYRGRAAVPGRNLCRVEAAGRMVRARHTVRHTSCAWRACLAHRPTGPAAEAPSTASSPIWSTGAQVRAFTDRIVSPGYVVDIAAATRHLTMSNAEPGLYHCVNAGHASWYDVAKEVAALVGNQQPNLVPVTMDQMKLKAPRPRYCALSVAKLAAAGFPMPEWRDALRRWLATRGALTT